MYGEKTVLEVSYLSRCQLACSATVNLDTFVTKLDLLSCEVNDYNGACLVKEKARTNQHTRGPMVLKTLT